MNRRPRRAREPGLPRQPLRRTTGDRAEPVHDRRVAAQQPPHLPDTAGGIGYANLSAILVEPLCITLAEFCDAWKSAASSASMCQLIASVNSLHRHRTLARIKGPLPRRNLGQIVTMLGEQQGEIGQDLRAAPRICPEFSSDRSMAL